MMKELIRLNLGCGKDILPGWINLDSIHAPGVDMVFDLNKINEQKLPYPDSSVAKILMSHILEHLEDPLILLQELWRVSAPGCELVIRVPHGGNDEAWIDPTHLRPYFPRSFSYFGQPKYHKFDYGYTADWRCRSIIMATPYYEQVANLDKLNQIVETNRNIVSEMVAVLTAEKPPRPREPRYLSMPEQLFTRNIPRDFDEVTNIAKKK